MQEGLTEFIDLSESDQRRLWAEVAQCCEVVRRRFACDKLNVAAIGNVVRLTVLSLRLLASSVARLRHQTCASMQCPDLHVHITARLRCDVAWPGPVR